MEIQHRQEGTHGEFYIEENGNTIAQYSYSVMDENTIIATHTGVSPRLRGQGIAMKLVEFANQYAREHNLKIVPSCSYVRWAYETRPELGEGVVK
jgi:uncharacterized protein